MLSSSIYLPGEAKLIFTIFPSLPPLLGPSWFLLARTQVRSGFNFYPAPSSAGHTRRRHPTGSSPCGTSENLHFYSPFHPQKNTLCKPHPLSQRNSAVTQGDPDFQTTWKGQGAKFQHLFRVLWKYHGMVRPLSWVQVHINTCLVLGWRPPWLSLTANAADRFLNIS